MRTTVKHHIVQMVNSNTRNRSQKIDLENQTPGIGGEYLRRHNLQATYLYTLIHRMNLTECCMS